jgi:peptidoglycan/LPS O-acetylase OafA/YrhL
VLIVGLLAPGTDRFFLKLHFDALSSVLFLCRIQLPAVFPGNHLPYINGSMWTILYEFRCYMVVAAFGVLGLFRRRVWWVVSGVVLLAVMIGAPAMALPAWATRGYTLVGYPITMVRFLAVFFIGGCFWLFRDVIQYRPLFAAPAATVLLLTAGFYPNYLEVACITFGAYLMFYFTQLSIPLPEWMKRVPDISYGIYLYGWPVESLLIWYFHWSPWATLGVATCICVLLGWLNWHLVDKPILESGRKAEFRLPRSTHGASLESLSMT